MSQPTSSSIAMKSSVVSPAAAAAAEAEEVVVVVDGSLLDVESGKALSEVPARTTVPSLVEVAAVTQSLPGVPSWGWVHARSGTGRVV